MIKLATYFNTEGGFGNKILNYIDAKKKGYEPFLKYRPLHSITGKKVLPIWVNFHQKLELTETFIGLNFSDLELILTVPKASNTGTVLHFRGTDFAQWKPHSIITSNWYLEMIKRFNISEFTYVTDDINHTTSKEIISYTQKKGIKIKIYNSDTYLSDWWLIFNSGLLISGPSTFSITAGILGRSDIILNREYAELETNSEFWQYLLLQSVCKSEVLSNIQLL